VRQVSTVACCRTHQSATDWDYETGRRNGTDNENDKGCSRDIAPTDSIMPGTQIAVKRSNIRQPLTGTTGVCRR